MSIYTHLYMYIHVPVYIYIYMCLLYVYMYIYIYMHACMHVYVYIDICMIHLFMDLCIHLMWRAGVLGGFEHGFSKCLPTVSEVNTCICKPCRERFRVWGGGSWTASSSGS